MIEVGKLYRSSAGNVWRVDRIEGDRVRVVLESNGTGSGAAFQGAGFWWHISSTADFVEVSEVAR